MISPSQKHWCIGCGEIKCESDIHNTDGTPCFLDMPSPVIFDLKWVHALRNCIDSCVT